MSTHNNNTTAWKKVRLLVLKRDNYVCAYDGRPATTVDHVVPKVKGGTDDMSNLVAACSECNTTKGAKTETRMNWFNPDWLTSL